MNTLTKSLLAAVSFTMLSSPLSHAQNWGYGGNYIQTVSGTTPQGRSYSSTVSTSYNQTCGAGGWMGTGCPNGLGWAIFGINSLRGMAAGAPVPVPVSAAAPSCGYGYEGGYYGGGCYGAGVYGQPYTVPTYRAGWGVVPN
jgi:hypothetical protein